MSAGPPVLLACAHGTRVGSGRAAVDGLVAAVARALPGVEVRAAYVDVQSPSVTDALDGLTGREVAVVPLLLSAGYHVHVDLSEAVIGRAGVTLRPALGPDRRIVDVLARRLDQVGLGDTDAVVLSSAGSSDARAVVDCEQVATALADRLGRSVPTGYLSAATPTTADAVATARASGADRIVVANHLLAPGFFADRATRCGADAVTAPLLIAGEAPDPLLVELVVDRYGGGVPPGSAQER